MIVYYGGLANAHGGFIEGFPLDSLAVEKNSDRYYFDIEDNDDTNEKHLTMGFRNFFERVLAVSHVES